MGQGGEIGFVEVGEEGGRGGVEGWRGRLEVGGEGFWGCGGGGGGLEVGWWD